jgi:hypothetical protein
MEKKNYLGVSLVLGVPALRLIEVLAVAFFAGGLAHVDYAGHLGLGLVIGVACTITAQIVKLNAKRSIWVLPILAVAYALVLLLLTYPPQFFKLNATYVSTMILVDLATWAMAVAGAAIIGYVAARPRVVASAPRITSLG